MEKFLDVHNNIEINFSKEDLPMVIHGPEHSGSSFFSITMAAHLHKQGNKILMFTAYQMATQEFLKQVGEEASVCRVDNWAEVVAAQSYQTVIVNSGDSELCAYTLSHLPDIYSRIVFIKNVEQVLTEAVAQGINMNERTLLSGNIDASPAKEFIKKVNYKTKIFFSDSSILPKELPTLGKYQACVFKENNKFIVSII